MTLATPALEIRNVSKQYVVQQQALPVLESVSLSIREGEFVSIVGASGCGKSTLLRLLVGLDDQYQGEISVHGAPLRGPSLDRGIVFQEHRLFPWLTVAQNVALGLENAPLSAEAKRAAVDDHIALVGLRGFESAYPHQLSGGMAQRAAIARGLVNQPSILLLDEPFGALDALTRTRMHEELQRIWQQAGVTMLLVTHDVDEAVYLGDRVVIMRPRPGRIATIVDVPLPRPRVREGAELRTLAEAVRREIIALSPPTALIDPDPRVEVEALRAAAAAET